MDLSFPSATIIASDSFSKEHQGAAASLVNTMVNYSISIGLGFAGTADSYLNRGGTDMLRGIRGAYYVSLGLASLGVMFGVLFVVMSMTGHLAKHPTGEKSPESQEARVGDET